jgi:hypothetical protein
LRSETAVEGDRERKETKIEKKEEGKKRSNERR